MFRKFLMITFPQQQQQQIFIVVVDQYKLLFPIYTIFFAL